MLRALIGRTGGYPPRKIGIEKTQCMRRLDDPHARLALLFTNLLVQFMHPRPVLLRAVVVLGVVAIVKPKPVV